MKNALTPNPRPSRTRAPLLPAFALPLVQAIGLTLLLGPAALAQETPRYLDPKVAIEDRISDLLPRMTVEEKLTQISDDWGSRGVARLKVPPLLKTEGLHSQSYSNGATVFPHAIAMASTFDTELVTKIGKQTAVESKAANIRCSWSPVLDVARDARWGRIEETYGESPYLVSRMGVAWINGFQGEGMIAVPKHFAGHGEPRGGRDSNDIGLSERRMREVHLPPFRAAFKEAHAGGVMAAYGTWEGVPDNASSVLLNKILKQEWGFDGLIVSDCGGPEHFVTKHAIAKNNAEASALATAAGVNMECGNAYKKGMAQALEEGLVTEAQLNQLVRQVLRVKMRLGLFENPTPEKMVWEKLPAYDTPESRAMAREVAVRSTVLLKNDKNLLPLNKGIKKIAVIGPNANVGQVGDYSPKILPDQIITVLQGIKAKVSPTTEVIYAAGTDDPVSMDTSKFKEAIDAAKQAEVAVLVVGDQSRPGVSKSTTGENVDGATLDFPGVQRQLIKEIQATGTPLVLVIVNGKPFTLAWEAENIPAMLVTWYPGEEGGNAAADILFGDRTPSGRLPLTWPRHPGQLPLTHDYQPSGRKYDYYDMEYTAQYPFGYGLSYTKFSYSNLRVTQKPEDPGFATVTADVENVGDRDGDEVVQLYVTDLHASVSTNIIDLQGFKVVALKKGEKKSVSFDLTPYQLSLLDADLVRRVEPGIFRVHIGGVSPDVKKGVRDERKVKLGFFDPLQGISGEFNQPKAYAAQFVYDLKVPTEVSGGEPFAATLTVTNTGNLTDVTDAQLYTEFKTDSHSFELDPGQSQTHIFKPSMYKSGDLSILGSQRLTSRKVSVKTAPARLDLQRIRMAVDDNAQLQITGEALNAGGEPYNGSLTLKVDGKAIAPQPLKLSPGERQRFNISAAFALSGLHTVQLNDLPQQPIVVQGGLGLALQNPLILSNLDEGQGTAIRNEITGKELVIKGTPEWVAGRNGKALEIKSSGLGIDAASADIYRKAFTLSAWVKIIQYGKGDEIGVFGGKAQMGADQDTTGTILQVGVRNKKPFMGFFGRDIKGGKDVPVGEWVNLTWAYDPSVQKGSLYINGNLDKMMDQKPYTGPLDLIGDAPALQHGSYLLDDIAVVQSCMTPQMIRQLWEKGPESLRQGNYTAQWKSLNALPSSIEATADLPEGAKITLVVETGDAEGKAISACNLELKAGTQSYPITGLKPGAQVRIRSQLSSTAWGVTPVLRKVAFKAGAEMFQWITVRDWAAGSASPSLRTNFGQP